jgi:WD40 repeat protein
MYHRIVLAIAIVASLAMSASAQLTEVGKAVGIEVLKSVAGKLTDVGLDYIFSKDTSAEERVKELQQRLSAYEAGLRQVDVKLAEQMAAFTKQLSAKTTAEDVRKIVGQTLKTLEDRTANLELRQDKLESRVRSIEELFGHLPPGVHPLTKDWLGLLLRSEQSRLVIAELRRTRPETSKVLQEALGKDRLILEEADKLHKSVLKELAEKLPERQTLLAEYKPGTPELRKLEEKLSSLTWLASVTRPVAKGPDAGRLGLPPSLFGPEAPEMVEAFRMAKADMADVQALYRQQLLLLASARPFLGFCVPRDLFSPKMLSATDKALTLAVEGFNTVKLAPIQEQGLAKALSQFAEASQEVKDSRKSKADTLVSLGKLRVKLATALEESTALFVEELGTQRPTNQRMTAYRTQVLLPLAAWVNLLDSGVGENELWMRLLKCDINNRITMTGHTTVVSSVAYSRDGKKLITASWDKTAKIWDATNGKLLQTLTGHTNYVDNACFSNDGSVALSGSWDMTWRLWNVETGEKLREGTTQIQGGAMQFAPDDATFVMRYSYYEIGRWKVSTGHALGFFIVDQKDNPSGGVSGIALSPDGKSMIATYQNQRIRMWDMATCKEIYPLLKKENDRCVAFSLDGVRLAFGTGDNGVIEDSSSGSTKRVTLKGHTSYINHIEFSRDGTKVLTGGHDTSARVWDSRTGVELAIIKLPGKYDTGTMRVAFNPDATTVALKDGTSKFQPQIFSLAEPYTRASYEASKATAK